MPTSTTDIVNASLRLIGGKRITSLTDGSKEANVAGDLFDGIRDDLLRSHKWNFATKSVQLARSATTPVLEFDYGYAVPSDWIRTVSVHDNDAGLSGIAFREELLNSQRVIMANAENVYIRYVAMIDDPNLWPADFIKAMEYALARDMAIPVAQSNTVQQSMDDLANKWLRKARSQDAMGSPPEKRPSGSWATARQGWR